MLAWAAASCMIALLLARKQNLGVTYEDSLSHFICLFFVRTRSYSSSMTLMNETSLCQNGG